MKVVRYIPSKVCSSMINYIIDEDNKTVSSINFSGGCEASLKALGIVLEGKTADEIIKLISDIKCSTKNTSCPMELANSLKNELKNIGER